MGKYPIGGFCVFWGVKNQNLGDRYEKTMFGAWAVNLKYYF